MDNAQLLLRILFRASSTVCGEAFEAFERANLSLSQYTALSTSDQQELSTLTENLLGKQTYLDCLKNFTPINQIVLLTHLQRSEEFSKFKKRDPDDANENIRYILPVTVQIATQILDHNYWHEMVSLSIEYALGTKTPSK